MMTLRCSSSSSRCAARSSWISFHRSFHNRASLISGSRITVSSRHPRHRSLQQAAFKSRNFSSSSSSSSSSSDSRSSPASSLSVPSSLPLVSPFLPIGHAPRFPRVLVQASRWPVLPSLMFTQSLDAFSKEMLIEMKKQVDLGRPYMGLFLSQEASAKYAAAEEQTDKQQETSEQTDKTASAGMSAIDTSNTPPSAETSAETDADPLGWGETEPETGGEAVRTTSSLPVARSLDDLHGVGVLLQFTMVDGVFSAHAHRRIVLRQHAGSTIEETGKMVKETQPAVSKASTASTSTSTVLYADIQHIEEPGNEPSSVQHDDTNNTPSNELSSASADTSDSNETSEEASTAQAQPGKGIPLSVTMPTPDEQEYSAYCRELHALIRRIKGEAEGGMNGRAMAARAIVIPQHAENPSRTADFFALLTKPNALVLQDLLSTFNVVDRLKKVLSILSHEHEELRLLIQIHTALNDKQRKANERHQMTMEKKIIDSLLGKSTRGYKQVTKLYTDKLKERLPSPEIQRMIEAEIEKLASMEEENSVEYGMQQKYVEWLTSVPYAVYTPEKYDLIEAEQILNADHYGMEDVKERILEIMATGKLKGGMPPGKSICLVGPPGVGKTSIGVSLARALQRKFYRFSVGGMHDLSEIKGHRRSYMGALPGKLIQNLKLAQCANPVIMIDEIDKMGDSYLGDPAAALLEVLDAEQNHAFMDHYLDVPVDLSKVLFICTANSTDTIPLPLADRMDFIYLSGYTWSEKVQIARRFLEPACRRRCAITEQELILTDDAVYDLIRWYCREAGVRKLQKQIEKIYSKVALMLTKQTEVINKAQQGQTTAPTDAEGEATTTSAATTEPTSPSAATTTDASTATTSDASTATTPAATADPSAALTLPIVVNSSSLFQYVGKSPYATDRLYEETPVGVSCGLGVNSLGGSCLFIESAIADQPIVKPGNNNLISFTEQAAKTDKVKRSTKQQQQQPQPQQALQPLDDVPSSSFDLLVTGSLGSVMQESSTIAAKVARRHFAALRPYSPWFYKHRVHLHVPSGALPKDGPSAGITMASSLLSLALEIPLKQGVAMTGELTATGRVLSIGGVKEKALAAKNAQLHTLILPADNQRDWDELQAEVKEGMTPLFVRTYDEVVQIVFPGLQAATSLGQTQSSPGAAATV